MRQAQVELRARFEALVTRAAELGHCAPTGRTPRELLARLADAGLLPDGELPALRHGLERALYGEGVSADAARELLAALERLAARVEARGSVLPPVEPERVVRGRVLPKWLPAVGVAALAVGLVFLLPELRCSPGGGWGGGGGGGGGGGMASGATRAAGSAAPDARGWARPSESARFFTTRVPAVLGGAGDVSFDTNTGTDGVFTDMQRADPFDPPRGWSHRTEVYDGFSERDGFTPADTALTSALGSGDDALHAYRVRVDVRAYAGRAVPLPTPSADFEVLSWRSTPDAELEFLRDANDTLLLLADSTRQLSLEYVVTSNVDYDTAPLPSTPFVPRAQPLPDALRADAERVLAHIGGLPAADYADTVTRLHDYFAGFVVAPLAPRERVGGDYLSVALARKGVCRHRATCFVVTARALGLPARLVTNRIHAFAEVQLPDGAWRRLEFRLPGDDAARVSRGGDWWLLGLLFAGALVALRADKRRVDRAYDEGGLQREDPTRLRALVASRAGLQAASLERLLDVVRQRLAVEWGCDDSDPDTLAAALADADCEPLFARHVEQVLALSRVLRDASKPPDATALQRAYWNSYHVLRVLDGSAPW